MPSRARQAAPPAPSTGTAVAEPPPPEARSIDEIMEAMRAISDVAGQRTLTDEEAHRYVELEGELAAHHRSQEIRQRQAAYEAPVNLGDLAAIQSAPAGDPDRRNPLAYTHAALDEIQGMIEQVRRGDGITPRRISNATLTTGTYGAPREWGRNVLSGPRLLHVVAGVPRQPIDAILAQFPQLTLPTPSAAVGEGASLVEYASSVSGSVTAGRFGRFTDLSQESLVGTDAAAIISMHQLGIALDLDAVLIAAVQTAAGAAVGFTADVVGNIRKAIAKVLANTAAEDPSQLVILAHPNDAFLLENVTPTGGQTIAEAFQRFSGALVYPSNSVTAGFMTVANLPAGVRFFEATSGAGTLVDVASVKTGISTIATALIGGYGITLAAGFAVMQDVVTP
jgi:hypothetical protein